MTESSSVSQLLLLRLVIAVSSAAVGAAVAVSVRRISHFWMCVLISFAAGALLSVVLFDLLPESTAMAGLVPGALAALSGYGLFLVLTRFVAHLCPACSATHQEAHVTDVTTTMVVAMTLHSFMDGLAICSGELSSHQTGLLVLAAVGYHKLPEGLALTLVLRNSSKMSRGRALALTLAFEAVTTLAGGLAGLFFLVPHEARWIGLTLGLTAGGFVFLVFHALLAEVVKHHPLWTVVAALSGAASIAAMGFAIGAF